MLREETSFAINTCYYDDLRERVRKHYSILRDSLIRVSHIFPTESKLIYPKDMLSCLSLLKKRYAGVFRHMFVRAIEH